MNGLTQHYLSSQWQSRDEERRLPSEWTFQWNLAVHLSHCVKFFGYYIKNPFLGNVMQLFKSWKPSNLNGHSPMHQAFAGRDNDEGNQPSQESGLREWVWRWASEQEFRKRWTPAEMALSPSRPGGLFPPWGAIIPKKRRGSSSLPCSWYLDLKLIQLSKCVR